MLAIAPLSQLQSIVSGITGIAYTASAAVMSRLQAALYFAQTNATTIASASASAAMNAASNMANNGIFILKAIRDDAMALFREGVTLTRLSKTLRFLFRMIRKVWPIIKWIWIFTKLMNSFGIWVVRTIEVVIYRIFHFKDCFLWYVLELIGFILYIPFEFVIWLFCMKPAEHAFWKLVDDIDCMFKDMTGFHIFHYSDTVLKKCYSMKFPPFPYQELPFDGDGQFTEEAFLRFVIEWFLPPTPAEVGEALHLALDLAKESAPIILDAAGEVSHEITDMFKLPPPDPNAFKKTMGDLFNM